MSGLSRVPSQGSPFHRGTALLGGVVLTAIVALAFEPWSPAPSADASASAASADAQAGHLASGERAGPTLDPAQAARTYRPEAFGVGPAGGGWTIHTRTAVAPLPALERPDDGGIMSGPVVDLGTADDLDVVVVAGPEGSRIDTIRLWRFDSGAEPERLSLDTIPAPWSSGSAWAIGLRAGSVADELVGRWAPGLYRLDLLLAPDERVRMVMLSVHGQAASPAPAQRPDAPSPFRLQVLRSLPDAATVWTYGGVLTGWARASADGDCRVAEVWAAEDPNEGCWAVPIGRASALGVNLPGGARATEISLLQIDPLPGTVAARTAVGVSGRAGLSAVWAPSGGLPDGIYRVTVTVEGGPPFHWYVEVGPDGRRAEAINALVAGLQR